MSETIQEGFARALHLILTGDPEVIQITLLTLETSFFAIILASAVGIPIGVLIGINEFRGKGFVKIVSTTLIGTPTVTLGLVLYLLWARAGPLGYLELLYTIQGISIGQALLVVPIVVSFTISAVESRDLRLGDLARTLGATELDTSVAVIREAFAPIALAIVAAFNRAFAELGIAMMIGGNIYGFTRVLTTTIALETVKGDWGLSIALSIILLIIVFTLNIVTGNIGAIANVLKKEI